MQWPGSHFCLWGWLLKAELGRKCLEKGHQSTKKSQPHCEISLSIRTTKKK